eukprot:1497475-Pleurochrysis_carterae.AAC.1
MKRCAELTTGLCVAGLLNIQSSALISAQDGVRIFLVMRRLCSCRLPLPLYHFCCDNAAPDGFESARNPVGKHLRTDAAITMSMRIWWRNHRLC